MGYTLASLRFLVSHHPVNVFLVGWDTKKLTPFKVGELEGMHYYPKSQFGSRKDLLQFAIASKPHVVFISGWMDQDYLFVSNLLKRQGVRIVGFIDNQWKGTMRQWGVRLLFSGFLKKKFDFVWVSGSKQVDFVRKMGYPEARIYKGFYTSDVDLFSTYAQSRRKYIQKFGYPKTVLFIGRFAEVKGIDLLLEAFAKSKAKGSPWSLLMVGNGPLKDRIEKMSAVTDDIEVKDFTPPEYLSEIINRAGIFVLPSIDEPWGVVIHEAAAAGIPVLTSDACGANTEFLREGYNGFSFRSGSLDDLITKMDLLCKLPVEQLIQMGNNSQQLASGITPSTWSSKCMEIITAK